MVERGKVKKQNRLKRNTSDDIELNINKDITDINNIDLDKEIENYHDYEESDTRELVRKKGEKALLPEELSEKELEQILIVNAADLEENKDDGSVGDSEYDKVPVDKAGEQFTLAGEDEINLGDIRMPELDDMNQNNITSNTGEKLSEELLTEDMQHIDTDTDMSDDLALTNEEIDMMPEGVDYDSSEGFRQSEPEEINWDNLENTEPEVLNLEDIMTDDNTSVKADNMDTADQDDLNLHDMGSSLDELDMDAMLMPELGTAPEVPEDFNLDDISAESKQELEDINIEDVVKNVSEDIEDSEGIEDSENIEVLEGIEAIEDSENIEDSEGIEDIENSGIDNMNHEEADSELGEEFSIDDLLMAEPDMEQEPSNASDYDNMSENEPEDDFALSEFDDLNINDILNSDTSGNEFDTGNMEESVNSDDNGSGLSDEDAMSLDNLMNDTDEISIDDLMISDDFGMDDMSDSDIGSDEQTLNQRLKNEQVLNEFIDEDANEITLDDFTDDDTLGNGTGSEGFTDQDELLELLNMLGDDDEAESGASKDSSLHDISISPEGDDMSDIFSDVLGAVSSLDDDLLPDSELPILAADEPKEQQKTKKDKKSKSADGEEKQGFFKRFFANIEEDEETLNKRKQEEEEEEARIELKKSEKKAKKEAAKKAKAEKKKEPKEKKVKPKKEKKPKPVREPEPEETGRINKAGAAMVMTVFLVLAIFILTGTDFYSYTESIKTANKYFEGKKYTKAYESVFGVKIKEADAEFAQQVRTVMVVNKQLDSYNRYYSMDKHPEALDALLKGIKRYDKYIESARALGVSKDLDDIRTQIVNELKSTYHLSEKAAYKIINCKTQEEYSYRVYEAVDNM